MKEDSKIMVKAQRRFSATTAAPKLDITMRTMNGDCFQTAPPQTFNSEYGKVQKKGDHFFSSNFYLGCFLCVGVFWACLGVPR